MNVFQIYRTAAMSLATRTMAYTATHKRYGISQENWELLTQKEPWTPEQNMQSPGIISEVCQVCLTIAGLPANSLPGQYVAAVIAVNVQAPNILAAASRAPQAYDAVAASGLQAESEVRDMSREQMQSLVLAYFADYWNQPPSELMDKGTDDAMVQQQQAKLEPKKTSTRGKSKP